MYKIVQISNKYLIEFQYKFFVSLQRPKSHRLTLKNFLFVLDCYFVLAGALFKFLIHEFKLW